MHPQPRVQQKAHALATTGPPEATGIPCTMVLTVSFVLFPVTGLSCHRRPQDAQTSLRTWRQRRGARTTRLRRPPKHRSSAQSLRPAPLRPSHPASNVRDDRETPLFWARDGVTIRLICVSEKAKYFRNEDWTGQIGLKCFAKIVFSSKVFTTFLERSAE
jgi:hypothetical protein